MAKSTRPYKMTPEEGRNNPCSREKQEKDQVFTDRGTTFKPFLTAEYPDCPDIENCQILG